MNHFFEFFASLVPIFVQKENGLSVSFNWPNSLLAISAVVSAHIIYSSIQDLRRNLKYKATQKLNTLPADWKKIIVDIQSIKSKFKNIREDVLFRFLASDGKRNNVSPLTLAQYEIVTNLVKKLIRHNKFIDGYIANAVLDNLFPKTENCTKSTTNNKYIVGSDLRDLLSKTYSKIDNYSVFTNAINEPKKNNEYFDILKLNLSSLINKDIQIDSKLKLFSSLVYLYSLNCVSSNGSRKITLSEYDELLNIAKQFDSANPSPNAPNAAERALINNISSLSLDHTSKFTNKNGSYGSYT